MAPLPSRFWSTRGEQLLSCSPRPVVRSAQGSRTGERACLGVAVGMERNIFYFQTIAKRLEFGGAVARPKGAQVREERTGLRVAPGDGRDLVAKADEGGFSPGAGF